MHIHHLSWKNPAGYGDLLRYIISGRKTVEGRKNISKYACIKPGDLIVFDYKKQHVMCLVLQNNKYKSLRSYLTFNVERALPNITNIDDGVEIYSSFVSEAEVHKLAVENSGCGFLGIVIRFISCKPYHEISVGEPHFTDISTGAKLYEGRLARGKFLQLGVHDVVIWTCNGKKCPTIVLFMRKFPTFAHMLHANSLAKTLPGCSTMDEGLAVYLKPTGFYSVEDEEKYGVISICVKRIRVD